MHMYCRNTDLLCQLIVTDFIRSTHLNSASPLLFFFKNSVYSYSETEVLTYVDIIISLFILKGT